MELSHSQSLEILVRKDHRYPEAFSVWLVLYDKEANGYSYLRPLEPGNLGDFCQISSWQMPSSPTFTIREEQTIRFFESLSRALGEASAFLPSGVSDSKEVEAMKKHINDLSEISKTLAQRSLRRDM